MTENVVNFVSLTIPDHYMSTSPKNDVVSQNSCPLSKEEDHIMISTLNAKIHKTPCHQSIAFNNLVCLLKPSYMWLTSPKISCCLKQQLAALAEGSNIKFGNIAEVIVMSTQTHTEIQILNFFLFFS